MYLFSRLRTMNVAQARKAAAWAKESGDFVTNNTGMEITTWQVVFGRPAGTYSWGSMVESHADFAEASAKLSAHDEYWKMAEAGAALFGEANDTFREIVHMTSEPTDPQVVVVTTAIIANKYAEAVEWGVEITDYASQLTGTPAAFTLDAYGPFGSVAWYGVFDDVAGVQRYNDVLNTDPGYIERLTKAGESDLFIPGAGERSLATRAA